MKEETCKTCKFFISGCCRRFPPTIVVYAELDNYGFGSPYPHTEYIFPDESHWCGEWKEKSDVQN